MKTCHIYQRKYIPGGVTEGLIKDGEELGGGGGGGRAVETGMMDKFGLSFINSLEVLSSTGGVELGLYN